MRTCRLTLHGEPGDLNAATQSTRGLTARAVPVPSWVGCAAANPGGASGRPGKAPWEDSSGPPSLVRGATPAPRHPPRRSPQRVSAHPPPGPSAEGRPSVAAPRGLGRLAGGGQTARGSGGGPGSGRRLREGICPGPAPATPFSRWGKPVSRRGAVRGPGAACLAPCPPQLLLCFLLEVPSAVLTVNPGPPLGLGVRGVRWGTRGWPGSTVPSAVRGLCGLGVRPSRGRGRGAAVLGPLSSPVPGAGPPASQMSPTPWCQLVVVIIVNCFALGRGAAASLQLAGTGRSVWLPKCAEAWLSRGDRLTLSAPGWDALRPGASAGADRSSEREGFWWCRRPATTVLGDGHR